MHNFNLTSYFLKFSMQFETFLFYILIKISICICNINLYKMGKAPGFFEREIGRLEVLNKQRHFNRQIARR